MTTNTTDHLQALRKQVADVLERHHPMRRGVILTSCACGADWPCDTVTLARQMTTLLDEADALSRDAEKLADVVHEAFTGAAGEEG